MTGKILLLLAVVGATCGGWIHRSNSQESALESKRVIGPTGRVELAEASMELLGRVDTGAATTSVHAESVRADGGMVSFDLIDEDGRRVPMRRRIVRTGMVHNAERSEKRVYVEMTLQYAGLTKRVLVNLNDRAHLTYPLLLGRNWLKDDFVVDVARAPELPSSAPRRGRELASLAASD